jgi:hypothetical protein
MNISDSIRGTFLPARVPCIGTIRVLPGDLGGRDQKDSGFKFVCNKAASRGWVFRNSCSRRCAAVGG